MKNIVITIVMFAIAAALVVAVIIPLSGHGKDTGTNVETRMGNIDSQVSNLADPIR